MGTQCPILEVKVLFTLESESHIDSFTFRKPWERERERGLRSQWWERDSERELARRGMRGLANLCTQNVSMESLGFSFNERGEPAVSCR